MTKKIFFYPLQFLLTLLISTFIQDNLLKTFLLFFLWILSFWPLSIKDIVYFVISSLVFTLSNYGALQNLTFEFKEKDILLMPYNELFMWGFYCLNAYRFHKEKTIIFPQHKLKWFLLFTVVFASSFSFFQNETYLFVFLMILLAIFSLIFRSKYLASYILYFLFMGIVVESLGLRFGLWKYPRALYFEAPIWAPLMWMNIGAIMSQVHSLESGHKIKFSHYHPKT